jgi:hypothetical protein
MALKTTELAVRDRWLSGDQILKLLKLKYDFHDCNDVSILVMARSLGSIGDINDGIQFNNSGFYRRKYTCLSKECIMFYYFQESTPPIFPNGRADWDKIKKGSEEFDVESAITSRFESRKEQEFDSIDRDLAARTRNNNKKSMTLEIMTRSILKGKGELTQITVTQMIQRGLNDKSSLTLNQQENNM